MSESCAGKVLITGARGFIGSALVRELVRAGRYRVVTAVRGHTSDNEQIAVGEINASTDWGKALSGCDVVVHLAARVHVMCDTSVDPLAEFRATNTAGTLNLARQAAEAGVRRFVFVSSVKVNGEYTRPGVPFKADDEPSPEDAYAVSKHEAERGLLALAHETGMEVTIIRPPLVYGPGVKANFQSMMRWLNIGVPLPLGAIHNQRSLVGLDNLIDLILVCMSHPKAANQVFLVSDGEDVSTTELLHRIAAAMGTKARLLPVPMGMLELGARLLGRADVAQRLCGNLQVDISKTQALLDWQPPVSLDEGLRRTAVAFLNEVGGADAG